MFFFSFAQFMIRVTIFFFLSICAHKLKSESFFPFKGSFNNNIMLKLTTVPPPPLSCTVMIFPHTLRSYPGGYNLFWNFNRVRGTSEKLCDTVSQDTNLAPPQGIDPSPSLNELLCHLYCPNECYSKFYAYFWVQNTRRSYGTDTRIWPDSELQNLAAYKKEIEDDIGSRGYHHVDAVWVGNPYSYYSEHNPRVIIFNSVWKNNFDL